MNGINKVILLGTVGSNAVVKDLTGNATLTTFSIATNESYQDKQRNWQSITEWHNIKCFNSSTAKTLTKGDIVYVEGKIKKTTFVKKDGTKAQSTDIVASKVIKASYKDSLDQIPSVDDGNYDDRMMNVPEPDLPF
jgi:single-strand DNA-binding protein